MARRCLLAVLGAVTGCTSLTYACSEDTHCGSAGRCEPQGWCSFPDADCESGRRFAEHSGGGFGNLCVDTPAGTTGSSFGSSSGGTRPPIDAGVPATTAGASTSSTTAGDTPSSASSSDGSSSDSSSESTGTPPDPCVGWVDMFDDGVIDPDWELFEQGPINFHEMVEENGELRWTFASLSVSQLGLERTLDIPFGRLRLHVSEVPMTLEGGAQVALVLGEDPSWDTASFLVWFNDRLEVRQGEDNVLVLDSQPWAELELGDDGSLAVSTSVDGREFSPQITLDAGLTGQGVWFVLYGQTWAPVLSEATGAVDSIELCEP